jgi:hypothetical protein
MSADESNSSVFNIDALKSSSKDDIAFKPAPVVKPKARESRQATASDCKKKIAEMNAVHRKQLQDLRSKYQADERTLRQELKEQARKSKEAVKEAGETSRKFYDNQLKQMRNEYRDQSATLRKELKQFLEDSVNNISRNQETKMNRESDERLDSLKGMIHEDFIEALQKKTEEIDLIRTDSENKIAEVVQESTDKSHRISQLEIKMKEISQYLPGDIQEEVYEQFGFEDELAALEEEPKPKRKGILGKLMSLS